MTDEERERERHERRLDRDRRRRERGRPTYFDGQTLESGLFLWDPDERSTQVLRPRRDGAQLIELEALALDAEGAGAAAVLEPPAGAQRRGVSESSRRVTTSS